MLQRYGMAGMNFIGEDNIYKTAGSVFKQAVKEIEAGAFLPRIYCLCHKVILYLWLIYFHDE